MSVITAESLNLLLFSAGSTIFAVDMEQIFEISEDIAQYSQPIYFHDIVNTNNTLNIYRYALVIKSEPQMTVIVENIIEAIECSSAEIKPLPPLAEHFAKKKGVWGILKKCNNYLFLIDFLLFAKYKVGGI